MFSNSSIPVFFSEYGCNEVMPRVFNEVESLYSSQMTGALSGGLIYEYSQEPSNYGLVEINQNGSVSLRTDFDNLQEKYNKLDNQFLASLDPAANARQPPRCAKSLISDAGLETSFDVPDQPEEIEELIKNGLGPQDAIRGKIVEVKETKPEQAYYGSNGAQVANLELRKLADDASNAPGGETTGGGQGGDGQQANEDKKDAAGTLRAGAAMAALAAVLAVLAVV